MIGALVIVFREVLEAALVVSVVAAAVKGLRHRGRWVSAGVALGIGGAAAVAGGIDMISRLAHGTGQSLFAAAVLAAAGLMLAGHNVWMASHGRQISARLKSLGDEVSAGRESVAVLVAVTALAVMREGSEVALFLYGIAASGVGQWQLLIGGVLGLLGGAAVGFALFAGLSRIPLKRLFAVSSVIILFIAAGMLARAAQFLVQANYLPALQPSVWNTSWLISGQSLVGRSLGALVGYTPAPSLLQVLIWGASFALIAVLMLRQRRPVARPALGAAALMVVLGSTWALCLPKARAGEYKVYSPQVVLGESELELRAYHAWGLQPQSGSRNAFKLALGHAFTGFWATEVYATAEQAPAHSLKFSEFEWENRFQLTPQGKYWADVGLINENEIPRLAGEPYEVSLGPSFEKDLGRYTARLNLLLSHQWGSHAASGVGVAYRAQLQYRWRRRLSPIIEAYGEPMGAFGPYQAVRNQLGPGVTGELLVGNGAGLRYSVVALIGAGDAAADATLVGRLEYEFY